MGASFGLLFAMALAGSSMLGAGASGSETPECLRSLVPLAADSVVDARAFVPSKCTAKTIPQAFRYDRSRHATRLARALQAGDVVRPFPEYGQDVIVPGDRLDLVVSRGAVRVERQVEALQEAHPGQFLFVRGSDGNVLSVRYEKDAR